VDVVPERPANSAFTMLFDIEEHVVDLYEVLTGIRLEPHTIKSVKLKDGMIRSRLYNDVSFITHDNQLFVLIEHQTTINPNMGFRILEYYVKLVSENLKSRKINLFGTTEIEIPKAKFFVVYNGKGKMPDLPILDLGDVQIKTSTKNIHFEELADKSTSNSVAGYARFVALSKTMTPYKALEILLEEGYLVEFLSDEERRNMFAEVYSYDNELMYVGRQEGRQEGRLEEKIEIAQASLANGLDVEMIALITGLDIETIESLK